MLPFLQRNHIVMQRAPLRGSKTKNRSTRGEARNPPTRHLATMFNLKSVPIRFLSYTWRIFDFAG